MDLKQIEKLMGAMERNRIKKIALKQEGFEIELERECAFSEMTAAFMPPPVRMHAVEERSEEKKITPHLAAGKDAHYYVTSPMVGTFYLTPSPEDPPFVRVGDDVREESVLCIIEAMKVMNEVKAGVKGKVVEVLVKNGDPVEFGTKIFRIDVK